MKTWLRYAGYLGLEACFAACLCSTASASADYVPPPEEILFARSWAIVDVTVTNVDDQKRVAIKVNEILRGRKCPPVLTGQVVGCIGQLGEHLKHTQRYILILYGQDVHAYFPVRLSARKEREVQYERTWISFEAFAKRLPVELTPGEEDPRKVLAAISESGGDAMARVHVSLKANIEFVRIAARISGNALLHASPAVRKDPRIVLGATRYNAQAWPNAHVDLWKDPTFVIRLRRAVPTSERILRSAHPKLRDDRELVMQVVKVNGAELAFASQRLRKDRQIVQAAGVLGLPHHADLRWLDDKPFMLAIMKRHGGWLGSASKRLKADREVVLTAVRSSGSALNYVSTKFRSDREIVLAAVTNHGQYLRLAAESLRGDREIVLAAVQSYGYAIRFAAPNLRKDKQICLAAVRQKGAVIQLVDVRMPGYREIALEALKQDGRALSYLPPELWDDRHMATAAVSQCGSALGYASPEIRGDPDIVLAAAKNHVPALAGAGGRLLGDPKFILTAARQSLGALAYAARPASLDSRIIALRDDRAGILGALKKGDVYALHGASNRLRSDPEFILQAITSGGAGTVAIADLALWDKPRFVLRAIEADPWILRFAPWRVRADRKYVLAAVAKDGLTFALADRTVRGDELIAVTALKSNPKLVDSFDRLARGGVQWCPKVRAAYGAALRQQRQRTAETIEKLAAKSDLIVAGTVAKTYDVRARDAGMRYDIRVQKVLKGKLAGKTLHFRSPGHVAHAKYRKGETVLLFLYYWGDRRQELRQLKPVTYVAKASQSIPAGGLRLWPIQTYLDRLGAKPRARTQPARSGRLELKEDEAQEKSTSIVQSGARHPHPASNRDLLSAYLGGNRDVGNKLKRISKGAQPDVVRIWKKLSEADRWKLIVLPGCVPPKLALSQAVRSIDADSVNVRRQAVRWLRRNKVPEAKPRLLKKLHTEKSSVRYEIVGALAEIGGKDVVDAMIELLAPDSWAAKGHYMQPYPGFRPHYWSDGRMTIIAALVRLKAKRSAPALLKILQEKGNGKGYLGEFIIHVLGDFGYGKAIPEFKTILAIGEIAGVNLHRAYGPERIAAERKRVKAKVNRLAARALLQLGDRSGCALLTKELANTDRDVRLFAAETFARFGDRADIPALERCRTDKDQGVREAAVEALKRIRAGKATTRPTTRPAVKLAPTHVWCQGGLVLRAYDRQHGIIAAVPVPRKLRKALDVPVSSKLKQGKAIVSYYRGKRIDNLLAPSGAPFPPSGVGGTEYETQKALSGSVTVTPLPGGAIWQKVEVTFKDLVFKGFKIKKIGPLKAQLGLTPPP